MPHCDTLNGPVVIAAKRALEARNSNYVLIWVPKEAEDELKKAFEKTLSVRQLGKEAKEVADLWFFETAVRLHRAGEGESFNGLKAEGASDPIIEKAEQAILNNDAHNFIDILEDAVEDELKKRFQQILQTKNYDINDLDEGRKYIKAYIEFVVFSHHLYEGLSKGHDLDKKSYHQH